MVDLVKNPTRLILLLSTTFFIWLFVGASAALGQDVGGFRGNVTDPTGGVVTNAVVKATEEKSGKSNSTTTNAVGEYELANAGVVAAELAMERAAQVVRPPAEVEFRLARDPGEVAGEVAVVDRSVSPRRPTLAELAQGDVLLAD